MPSAIGRIKIRGQGSFSAALLTSVHFKHPHSYDWKRCPNRRKRKSTVEEEGFEKTLQVCQRKKGCAALNHKSFSRLCQISSTLQALKRNKEALLFAFPFSEGDRKLKGGQINLKGEQSAGWCGAGSGAGAAGGPSVRTPAAAHGVGRCCCPASLRTAPRPRAGAGRSRAGGRAPRGTEKHERRPSAARPAVAPGRGGGGVVGGVLGRRRGARLGYLGEPGGDSGPADRPSEPRAERWPGRCWRDARSPPSSLPFPGPRGAERRQKKGREPGSAVRAPRPALSAAGAPSPAPHAPARAPRPPAPLSTPAPHTGAQPAGRTEGDADTHRPAAEGRVLLIHFPLARARPGRRGRGPAGGNGRSAPGTVRAARCTRAPDPERSGERRGGSFPTPPNPPRDRRTERRPP